MKIETSPGNLKFKKEQQLSRCAKSVVENNGWGGKEGVANGKGLCQSPAQERRNQAVAGLHAK